MTKGMRRADLVRPKTTTVTPVGAALLTERAVFAIMITWLNEDWGGGKGKKNITFS